MNNKKNYSLFPQRGIYFARSIYANIYLHLVDAILRLFIYISRIFVTKNIHKPARRILIANGAHLGDVIIATSVLPVLKKAIPDVQIGMLVGSWADCIVNKHPMINWVHHIDHWRLNRSRQSFLRKFNQWRQSRAKAISEIRKINYDVAIDLYFYYPNSIVLLWQANIPERIGYTSAGFGPLLTIFSHIKMYGSNFSMIDYHFELLKQIPNLTLGPRSLAFPAISRNSFSNLTKKVLGKNRYIILHMGSGSDKRDWPEDSWVEVASELGKFYRIILTGTGLREKNMISNFCLKVPSALNFCDKLSWIDFVETIANADLLIATNTAAIHIANAVGTSLIVISHGMNNIKLWYPSAQNSIVLMKPMYCAPCYRNDGCVSMECVKGLTPRIVIHSAIKLLRAKKFN
jgi:ADP-heptose:LPS heptosyltransferase